MFDGLSEFDSLPAPTKRRMVRVLESVSNAVKLANVLCQAAGKIPLSFRARSWIGWNPAELGPAPCGSDGRPDVAAATRHLRALAIRVQADLAGLRREIHSLPPRALAARAKSWAGIVAAGEKASAGLDDLIKAFDLVDRRSPTSPRDN